MFHYRWVACLLCLMAPLASADESTTTQQWINAIEQRNTTSLKRLLPDIDNINHQDAEGKTALMVAAVTGDIELLKLLLRNGCEVDLTNHRGGTALMYAAARNELPSAQSLVNHHADINLRAENGWTALILAAAKGNHEMVGYLLLHGANPNIPDVYGWTALMRAIQHGRPRVISHLVRSDRLEIDRINNKGQSALHIAALENDCGTIKLLIDHGANRLLKDFRQRGIEIPATCR